MKIRVSSPGLSRINVIRAIRFSPNGMGLRESKDAVDLGAWFDADRALVEELQTLGATVETVTPTVTDAPAAERRGA